MDMVDLLEKIDRVVFLFLNSFHNAFFDPVFFWGTKPLVWLPLFFFLLYVTIRSYRWQFLWVLLFTVILIALSDQLSNFTKEWIARPRPTHEPGLKGIHTVYGYTGGLYGFYSGHASTTMAIAVFLILLLKDRSQYIAFILFPWAVFMSYTRIYLGVHYPGDILCGMIIGAGLGCAMAWAGRSFFTWLEKKRGRSDLLIQEKGKGSLDSEH